MAVVMLMCKEPIRIVRASAIAPVIEGCGAEHGEAEWFGLIAAAAAEGRFVEMRAALDQCLQQYPHSARARHLLAAELIHAGDREAALREYEWVLAAEPAFHEARLQCAMLLLLMRRTAQVEQVLAGFDMHDVHPAIHAFRQGLQLIAQDQLVAAMQRLRDGTELHHPNESLVSDMRAVARAVERQHEAALAAVVRRTRIGRPRAAGVVAVPAEAA